MTGQRTWVCTLDGDAVADNIGDIFAFRFENFFFFYAFKFDLAFA